MIGGPGVGMVPMGEDPFNDPFPTGGDGRAVQLWQERQRRARSVRLMVMFMAMLLLLDGEEAGRDGTRRGGRDQHNQLRRGGTAAGTDGNRGGGGGTAAGSGPAAAALLPPPPLDPDLFRARREQDGRLGRAASLDARFGELVGANGGRDVGGDMLAWAEREAAEMEMGGEGGRGGGGGKEGEEEGEGEVEVGVEEDGSSLVHHYPRNVTGYYRGQWSSMVGDWGGDGVGDGDGDVRTSHGAAGGANANANANSTSTSASAVVTDGALIEAAVKGAMAGRNERVGVYLLPPGMVLGDEGGGGGRSRATQPRSHPRCCGGGEGFTTAKAMATATATVPASSPWRGAPAGWSSSCTDAPFRP
jgi:hypothetical protein